MSKKIEELLPDILRNLSNGISVSTMYIQRRYGVSSSSTRAHLRSLKKNFFKKDIAYDASVKKWVALRGSFLDKILLKPEEIVVLNSMLRNKNSLGKSLGIHIEKVIDNYLKRTKTYIFKQKNSEKISEKMEENFAIIQTAIDEKRKLEIQFANSARVFYPHRVVNIEYYWYLLGFEESKGGKSENSQRIKSFALAKIEKIDIIDDVFEYDFSKLGKRIEHAMNAYFSLEKPVIMVNLLVEESIVDYIDRAQFFDFWNKKEDRLEIGNRWYIRYDVGTSDEEFRDITPTILKYMPNILVEYPDELKNEVMKKLDEYKKIYKS